MSKPVKEIAAWLPDPGRLAVEAFLSACSYLTLPWYNPKEGGVRAYFEANYYEEPDASLFDGSEDGYFSKLNAVAGAVEVEGKNIVDLGCGRGELYRWLVEKTRCDNYRYTGVDFAYGDVKLADGARIVRDEVRNVDGYLADDLPNFIVACNCMCYLGDEEASFILRAARPGDSLVVVDPAPGMFWHAHFNGIKPKYRSLGSMEKLVRNAGFDVLGCVQDYCVQLGGVYLFPVSYCLFAEKPAS